jgi:hypothetical protein
MVPSVQEHLNYSEQRAPMVMPRLQREEERRESVGRSTEAENME